MSRIPTPHEWRLYQGGDALFAALIEAMAQARSEILLETYIFDFHGQGADVAQALADAAARGVRVQVVVDGVGTPHIPDLWRARWQQAGVHWRVFDPVGPSQLWFPSRWRRLHRKLCVVDATLAFCGGINILDDHHDPLTQLRLTHPRLDYAAGLQGPVVQEVYATMTQLWARIQLASDMRNTRIGAALERLRHLDAALPQRTRRRTALVLRDNWRHRTSIMRTYLRAIGRARHDILMANAFFFPSGRLRRALQQAAQRGVRVRLLLQGHYEYAVPYRAARQVYGELMAHGVEIWEYRASYLHAKVAVVDERWATVGSSNLDPLSLLLAREANVVTPHRPFVSQLRQSLELALQEGAVRIDPQVHARRNAWQRLLDWGAWVLMRLAILVTARRY